MKQYLTIALLLVAAAAFGQSGTVPLKELRDMYSLSDRFPTADAFWVSTPSNTRSVGRDSVYSTYDTTVLNAGKVECWHEWVDKRNYGMYSGMSGVVCAVYHGPTGCPDTWLDKERICSKCLRYEHVKERRGVIRLVPEVTFEELKARIK